jgi:uncharacterized protein (DUF952 family)
MQTADLLTRDGQKASLRNQPAQHWSPIVPPTQDPIAYHLVLASDWADAPGDEPFRPSSLETEGFVRLTHRMADLVDVANIQRRHEPGPHVVLTIELRRLRAPWRYDGDERYPQVYGPLDRTAITEVRPISRDAERRFLPIERPDKRRPPDIPALTQRPVAAGVQFVVIGSGAASLLGARLRPGDLDICPSPDPDNLRRLAIFLARIGARPRVDVPGWVTEDEAAAWRPRPDLQALELLFETPFGDVDVLAAAVGPDGRGSLAYEELEAESLTVTLAGVRLAVASPAHLLASKIGARRPKDLRARAELERLAAEFAQG